MLNQSRYHATKVDPLITLTKSIHIDENKLLKFTNSIHSYINDELRTNFTPASNQYELDQTWKHIKNQEPSYTIKGKYHDKTESRVGYEHNEQTSSLKEIGGEFTKYPRMNDKINENPGPGTHKISRQLNFDMGSTFPGNNMEFKLNENPAPNQYDITSADIHIHSRAPAFTLKGAITNINKDNFPGPGQYQIEKSLRLTESTPAAFSFPKDSNVKTIYQTPGPQDYADFPKKQMSKSQISNRYIAYTKEPSPGVGSYNINKSSLSKSGAGKFGGKSFQRQEINPTGPGQYDISREQRICGGSMGKSSRESPITSNPNIGPGKYNIPTKQPRATSIGIRSELSSRNDNPGPNAYHMKSTLKNSSKSIGIKPKTFGNPFPNLDQQPGPSDYQLNENPPKYQIKKSTFSRQSRDVNVSTLGKGPATYNTRQDDQNGGLSMRFRQYGFTL
eukprot:EST44562.1 SHIPPO 1-like protein [Spironucleus salmonicida]